MTTTPTPTSTDTTTYSLRIPFVSSAFLEIELPTGLTNEQVLEQISSEAEFILEYDHEAIRAGVLDSVAERKPCIEIETDD